MAPADIMVSFHLLAKGRFMFYTFFDLIRGSTWVVVMLHLGQQTGHWRKNIVMLLNYHLTMFRFYKWFKILTNYLLIILAKRIFQNLYLRSPVGIRACLISSGITIIFNPPPHFSLEFSWKSSFAKQSNHVNRILSLAHFLLVFLW